MEFEIKMPPSRKKRNTNNFYCCRDHKYKHQPVTQLGSNNGNYGKKHTDEWKKLQGELIKKALSDPAVRWRIGTANRGKKFSEEKIKKMMENRIPENYSHPHSDASKEIIGRKSQEKFTEEFKKAFRIVMEELGHWVKLSDKKDSEIYFAEANWKEKMFDKIVDKDQLFLLETLKVFNNKTNTKGVVRDHIFGRKDGFELGVFPEIIRHPCNCQILTHSDNVKKRSNKNKDRSDIGISELFQRIKMYTGDWKEQEIVLLKIKEYENGERWINQYKQQIL